MSGVRRPVPGARRLASGGERPLDEDGRHLFRPTHGLVHRTHRTRDAGSLVQDEHLGGQIAGRLGTALPREVLQKAEEPRLLVPRDLAGRVVLGQLHRRVDEGAAPLVPLGRPLLQCAEGGENPLTRRPLMAVDVLHQHGPPQAVPGLEVGDDEIVLGAEAVVERLLGDARLLRDRLHADGPDPEIVEEPGGRFEDSHTGRRQMVGTPTLCPRRVGFTTDGHLANGTPSGIQAIASARQESNAGASTMAFHGPALTGRTPRR
ncbi:protein of unknown function [Streptomyces sp. KY70]|nr:protein of unknown function [Streptomyces sp. KY70]